MRKRLRYALVAASVITGACVFVSFTFVPEPGLGLPHFFYVSIILAAFAGGPWIGAAAATVATAMYTTGVVVNPAIPPSEVLTSGTAVRLVTYLTVGVVTGYFATRNRELLADLELLAERDALTGLPNTRAFERAIDDRLSRDEPFALLVGGVDSLPRAPLRAEMDADDLLRQIANCLLGSMLPGDDVARIGDDTFAVLTYATSAADAGRIAARLQGILAESGFFVTFGWSASPQDGRNALSLYRAADERLYARRVIQREATVIPLVTPRTREQRAQMSSMTAHYHD